MARTDQERPGGGFVIPADAGIRLTGVVVGRAMRTVGERAFCEYSVNVGTTVVTVADETESSRCVGGEFDEHVEARTYCTRNGRPMVTFCVLKTAMMA